jgi:hypothetical protein
MHQKRVAWFMLPVFVLKHDAKWQFKTMPCSISGVFCFNFERMLLQASSSTFSNGQAPWQSWKIRF